MTKFSQGHPANSGENLENECQERITAQKLITQFWGCYNSSPLKKKSRPRDSQGYSTNERITTPEKNLGVNF